MSKEHFETGSGEGKDIGIIPPVIKDYKAPLRGGKDTKVFGVKYSRPSEEGTGGVVAEETVREDALPTTGRKRGAPKEPKRVGTAAETPRGFAEGARPKTRDVAQMLEGHVSSYMTTLNNAASIKSLSDKHRDAIDAARFHLSNAKVSHGKARTEGRMGTNTQNRDVTHGHLQDVADHLSRAHETIVGSGVHKELANHSLNGEIPSDDRIRSVVSSAYKLSRTGVEGVAGATKPYGKVPFGRGTIPGAAIDEPLLKKAREVGGKASTAVQKLEAGAKGTKRDPMRREKTKAAVTELKKRGAKIDKLPTGAGGRISGIKSGAPVNPKRRAGATRVDTQFRSQANDIGRTPKFKG